jgi:hypothetical protein
MAECSWNLTLGASIMRVSPSEKMGKVLESDIVEFYNIKSVRFFQNCGFGEVFVFEKKQVGK